jgi:hypothetical protein
MNSKNLRGHLQEEDFVNIKKMQTRIYGHLNIDKLA